MRIIFMGTPEFAVPSLQILHESAHEVVAVVTVPDKPAGRGRKLRASAVKQYAQAAGIPVLQPVKLRDPEFHAALAALSPDLMVVVAFRMLPKVVWAMPRMGTFNLHASLLPDYRGAAPINWVVMNGETETGLTTFLIDEKIDTGNLLLQERVEIQPDWTAGELHDHMMALGANLVLETTNGLSENRLVAQIQDEALYQNKAPKIHKEDCRIDWSADHVQVYNHIRGLSPYPTAWTLLEGQPLKVYGARLLQTDTTGEPGQLIKLDEERLAVFCGQGQVELTQVQLAGKKRMSTADFLRGYKGPLTQLGK